MKTIKEIRARIDEIIENTGHSDDKTVEYLQECLRWIRDDLDDVVVE